MNGVLFKMGLIDRYSSYDPYDLWATKAGVNVRKRFYEGRLSGKFGAGVFALIDWAAPVLSRSISSAPVRLNPITAAHLVLMNENQDMGFTDSEAVDALASIAAWKGTKGRWAWGLGFQWMSKNGLYGDDVPFVTHTPYVMEALLQLTSSDGNAAKVRWMFEGTWGFLESLRVMHDGKNGLALSYAPVEEPRIVVNANAYASYAYALHAVHGNCAIKDIAIQKAQRIVSWIVGQQNNGKWYYYADTMQGNFIDCFHTCFVLKNLIKVRTLLPELKCQLDKSIEVGFDFLQKNFYDKKTGLCRRFIVRDIKDLYRWDIYDQAEYLGLLIDMGDIKGAKAFIERVRNAFYKGGHWWCRIDVLGRRWGKDFMRWGIIPFLYQSFRLEVKG